MKKSQIPGSIFQNNGRWWWRVTLPGEAKRRAIPLKPTGSRYATKDRSVAERVALEILERSTYDNTPRTDDNSVRGIVQAYLDHARTYYQKSREVENLRYGLNQLVDLFGDLKADDFGPMKLKEVRECMIKDNLCRTEINKRIGMVKRMFKWAAENERIPSSIAFGVSTVQNLKKGRSEARETPPIKPVPTEYVYQVLPYASPTIAAMIELQLLTGMRSGELCHIRPLDVDMSGDVWLYTPTDETGEAKHKSAHLGLSKYIAIGPKAQKILSPYMNRKVDSFCFSPAETVQASRDKRTNNRKTPLSCGNVPGSNQKENPRKVPGNQYSSCSYNYAVTKAIKKAEKDGKEVVRFTPHQLRHTAATLIRKEFGAEGLEFAAASLGHKDISATKFYAELQTSKAIEAARKLG
ncbi:tyrosine-type recombinase/integrase [Planctomycetota bacterium]